MIDLNSIPNSPGCYLFKDKKGTIIYIGKAKDLKKRVKSYFQKKEHSGKTQALVKNISSVDFFLTDNEVEALLLENNLIKKHLPKYNIDLKDSKRYAYIRVSSEKFPRLLIARNTALKGDYFGPFVSGIERDFILSVLKRTFKFRTCKKLPKKPCLRFHIGLCNAPCTGNISEKNYSADVLSAKKVLDGKTEEILKELLKRMGSLAKKQDFESALTLRDQIRAIEGLDTKQKIDRNKKHDEDIINYFVRDNRVYLLLFNVYRGTLENKQEFTFDSGENFFEEFLVRYYSENKIPKEIIVPEPVDSSIKEYLQKLKKGKIKVTRPKTGEKKMLLELVKKNIELSFFRDSNKLDDLRAILKLNENPAVIECFDISHLSGTSTVGSMVQFRHAKPDKSNYRRFKIRSVEGIDDVLSIAEVVRRRYTRLQAEGQLFPNLIVIDGGRGQLNFALNELKKLGLRIPIISLAKKFEEIYVPGLNFPLQIDKKRSGLKLLQEIRDEAHRFAISYNRLLRKKELRK
jgi:excinuclease ABC subunit C